MTYRTSRVAPLVLLLLLGWSRAAAQGPAAPVGQTPKEAPGDAAGDEGPSAQVENPLGDVPPDDPGMESYSHGNYLLYLVDILWSAAFLAIVVFSGFAATLQEWAGKAGRSPNRRVAIYAVLFALVTFAGGFPLDVYAGFLREKAYGFANQTFAAWLGDRGKRLLVSAIVQAIFFVILYVTIRRLGRRWWVAGSILAVLFVILVMAIYPVFIAPLFNTFEPLKDARLRAEILEMARREGIPADEVYQVDASRQSSHDNAYVAGLLGTQRIVLYDTILEQFTPREINTYWDSTGQIGGPIVKDKLFFFTGFQYFHREDRPAGFTGNFTSEKDPRTMTKLTWAVSPNVRAEGFVEWDKFDIAGRGASATRPTTEVTALEPSPEWLAGNS